MLYPLGAPVRLLLRSATSDQVVHISANRDRNLIAVLTPQNLLIFQSKPQFVLVSFSRSEDELREKGANLKVVWKPDSSAICVTTIKNYMLVYKVEGSEKDQSYSQKESRDPIFKRTSQELFLKDSIPRLRLVLAVVIRLSSNCTCLVPLREELFVCLKDGWVHRLLWNGTVLEDFSIHVSKIPFSIDQMQSRAEYLESESSGFVSDCAYSPLIGGFSLVLSNGRAALLTCPSPKFHPNQVLGVWAPDLVDALCTAVNHNHRLLSFGCKNSEICSYHLDEFTGALIQAYRVKLVAKDNPEVVRELGAVRCLEWSPYGTCLASAWKERPVLALWSTFGAQIWCSQDSNNDTSEDWKGKPLYSCVDWGCEGYQLWSGDLKGLSLLSLAKSISIDAPAIDREKPVILLGSDSIYLSPPRVLERAASAPHSAWNIIQAPSDYISSCWPLRYCALSMESGTLCVAGSKGLTHCSLKSQKWRLFGNVTQEREMIVTGGLMLWRGFILCASYDMQKEKDDLRFYPTHRQLDNLYCTKLTVDAQILMMNLREDVLVTFDVESRICLYQLKIAAETNIPGVVAFRNAEVLVSDLIPHPACIISVQLTALNHDSNAAEFCGGADTLLVNVAGRLVMLSPQKMEEMGKSPQQLQQPMLVASYVEEVWHEPMDLPAKKRRDSAKPHLSQALWLRCGSKGMKVWLPLFPEKPGASARSFISKRIMLPFHLGIYPLVICSKDCLAIGVCSVGQVSGASGRAKEAWTTSWHVQRNSEVFLQHILRQLLKRNLGLYALEIAATCTHLPYFPHVLELLLHQVLEEEASSSEPIPDPLLPRVVAFIQEFPEFLRTVAHCARKTELALWQQLFAKAGHPRDLFEVCLRDGQLDTAASFLIVLQNMTTAAASKDHAIQLLEASLERGEWAISTDIIRFLKAIDPSDIDSPPRTPLYQKQQGAAQRLPLVSPTAAGEADAFVFQPMGVWRQRHSSLSAPSPTDMATGKLQRPTKEEKRLSLERKGSVGNATESSVHEYLNLIVNRHARELLSGGRLGDLGRLAGHLEFHLVLWLGKERNRAARVQEPVASLQRLHGDFRWPLPLLSYAVVSHLSKKVPGFSPAKQQPLKVITRMNSTDSGVKTTLDWGLSKQNDRLEGRTRQLLMKQSESLSPRTLEARLQPKGSDKDSVAAGTEVTEESWLMPSSPSWDAEPPSTDLDWEGLEQLCGEAAARGSQQTEAELRFLQQIMLEAGCLEWSLLICLVLRDLVGFARAVNSGGLTQAPVDTLKRLRGALVQLTDWADEHCLGYKPLLLAAEKHLDTLNGGKSSPELEETLNPPRKTESQPNRSSSAPSVSQPQEESKPKMERPKQIEVGKNLAQFSCGPAEGIHVDIVNPMSPPKSNQEGVCAVM